MHTKIPAVYLNICVYLFSYRRLDSLVRNKKINWANACEDYDRMEILDLQKSLAMLQLSSLHDMKNNPSQFKVLFLTLVE